MASPQYGIFVDGSHTAEEAFKQAVTSACKDHALLHIITSAEKVGPTTLSPIGTGAMGAYDFQNTNDEIEKRAEGLVALYEQKAKDMGCSSFKGVVLRSFSARDAAVSYVNDQKLDCVYVGSRGLGPFQRFFLGSFSNALVNQCHCNVMVIKHYVTGDAQVESKAG